MGCQKRRIFIRKFTEALLIGGLLFINSFIIIGTIANGETSNDAVAIFYGSDNDKKLAQELVTQVEVEAYYYNITAIQMNSSFVFDNKTIVAIWWINELLLPIDLTFVGDINDWKQAGRGLFVLNRYFKETPLQELTHLGITAYAPVVYPLNEEYVNQDLNITSDVSKFNITQTSYSFNCSSGWVVLNNDTQIIAELSTPESETYLSELKSGIWLAGSRIVVGSFSIGTNSTQSPIYSHFSLDGLEQSSEDSIVSLLGELIQITLGSVSLGNTPSLLFGGLDQIASIALISIASIFSLLVLLKTGLLSRIREIVFSLIAGFLFFIAHIAYSPQKRRINENQLLENELRYQIVDYLEQKGEQGAHLREIQREIGCGISSLLWHLQALDDFNLVTHEKIGKYHIFYLTGTKSVQSTEIALALKSEVAKALCRVLIMQRRPVSLSKLSQKIDVHHSSAQHHIKKLADIGLIIILKEKKRSQYIISPKRKTVVKEYLEVA